MSEQLVRACESACELLEASACALTQWADESRQGGWSTHQVERNYQMSLRLSAEASRLRVLVKKTREPAYLESINAAGVGERVEFPKTRSN